MVLNTTLLDPLVVARAIHFATTIVAAGTLLFRLTVAEPAFLAAGDDPPLEVKLLRRRWNWLVLGSLFSAVLSALTWLALLAANIYGTSIVDVCLHGGVWTVPGGTRFGQVSIIRLVLAILLAVAVGWPSAADATMGRLVISALLAVALLTSLAWIGHAGATPGLAGQFHMAADALHLMAAGAWIGGLPPLAMLLACARRSPAPRWANITITVVRRFSWLGIGSVGTLLATGLVNTLSLVGGIEGLTHTDYGQLLLLKIGLFVAMVGIAAINRFHLTPRLATAGVVGRLQRNSTAEIVLGATVLLLVGALGTMPPASHSHHNGSFTATEVPDGAAFVHIHSEEGMAEITIMPGRPGTSDASIRLLTENLDPLAAETVTITLTAPSAGSKPMTRIASRAGDGYWTVKQVALSRPGIWTVAVHIAFDATRRLVLDGPIVITP
jgi:copper resistance protein D